MLASGAIRDANVWLPNGRLSHTEPFHTMVLSERRPFKDIQAWEGFGMRISDPAMRGKVERAYCAAMGNCWFRLRDAEKAVEIYQRGQALSIAADDPVDIKVAEESLVEDRNMSDSERSRFREVVALLRD